MVSDIFFYTHPGRGVRGRVARILARILFSLLFFLILTICSATFLTPVDMACLCVSVFGFRLARTQVG